MLLHDVSGLLDSKVYAQTSAKLDISFLIRVSYARVLTLNVLAITTYCRFIIFWDENDFAATPPEYVCPSVVSPLLHRYCCKQARSGRYSGPVHTETFLYVFVLFTVLKGIENNQLIT